MSNVELPEGVVDAVCEAFIDSLTPILEEPPQMEFSSVGFEDGPGITGVISFTGAVPMTIMIGLPADTAGAIAEAFTGMEIPFDEPDMSDLIGELANVIAGDVSARLELEGMQVQMSLPTVVRGLQVNVAKSEATSTAQIAMQAKEGKGWVRVTTGTDIKTQAVGSPVGAATGAGDDV